MEYIKNFMYSFISLIYEYYDTYISTDIFNTEITEDMFDSAFTYGLLI